MLLNETWYDHGSPFAVDCCCLWEDDQIIRSYPHDSMYEYFTAVELVCVEIFQCAVKRIWNISQLEFASIRGSEICSQFLTVQFLCTRLWCHACFLSTGLRLMPRHLFPWTGRKTLAQALLNCCYSSKTPYFIMPTHIQTWLISGKIDGLLSVGFEKK